ncbi:MAG: sodium-dependent transporter [Maricaulaceae bacterium]
MTATQNVQWSSRFAFIMAAVGSSVGLGNLWRFSAEVGNNGGGAFILLYLLCVLFIGIPVLICEYVIGRAGNASSAVESIADVSRRSGANPNWGALGWIGQVASFLIVAFYCVVAAWVMMYIPKFFGGTFDAMTPEQINDSFGANITNWKAVLPYFTIFAVLTTLLVARGVNKGIEMTAKFLMPLFFIMLIGLALFGLTADFSKLAGDNVNVVENSRSITLKYLFSPDFNKISDPNIIVAALGQAFFSIGLGSAIMITYGSYLPRSVNIPRSAMIVGLTDTGVALIAGLAIFPVIFAFGIDPGEGGAGLFFKSIPIAMQQIPGGNVIGGAFFFLAIFAAITSSVSLLEPITAYVSEKFNMTKAKAAYYMGGLMWLVGLISMVNLVALDAFDKNITGALMLPLCGLLAVLYVGWNMDKKILDQELEGISDFWKKLLLALVKFVAPACVAVVLGFSFFFRFFKPNLSKVKPEKIAETVAEFNAIRDVSLVILAVLIGLTVIGIFIARSKSKAS